MPSQKQTGKNITEGSPEAGKILCTVLFSVKNELEIDPGILAKLLRVRPCTLKNWNRTQRIALKRQTTREILQTFLAIYRHLGFIFEKKEERREWLITPHPNLGGVAPLDYCAKSLSDMFYVRDYLKHVRTHGA